ncbi:hypothetical protein B0H17DRAFT_1330356 [Mycena rosella]|uniref:Uncharacterized protein n=1 Tax=Mycena rosella TaxID=1033263 RepID=A0AAD7DKV6_MYCRO|nr:hypothetical protein B0H17DRAFT_1330356 [Mycena rosella]
MSQNLSLLADRGVLQHVNTDKDTASIPVLDNFHVALHNSILWKIYGSIISQWPGPAPEVEGAALGEAPTQEQKRARCPQEEREWVQKYRTETSTVQLEKTLGTIRNALATVVLEYVSSAQPKDFALGRAKQDGHTNPIYREYWLFIIGTFNTPTKHTYFPFSPALNSSPRISKYHRLTRV